MFTDIVLSSKTDAFEQMAKRLGSRLLYVSEKPIPKELSGFHVSGNKFPGGFDIYLGGVDLVEHPKVKLIWGFEADFPKDKTHQRNSGLNQVICKAAKAHEKIIAFDFSALLTADRPLILGRMQQNARLIKKYKNDFIIASFARTPFGMRSGRDFRGFLEYLGFSAGEAKQAVGLLDPLLAGKTFK